MSEYSDDRPRTSTSTPRSSTGGKKGKSRQLLSCVKCRERKVKCDRTKPCTACCVSGQPKGCHFVAEDGDFGPIQQSYLLKKIQAENIRLKKRLRLWNIPIEDDESDLTSSPDSFQEKSPSPSQKRRTPQQPRLESPEWQHSIYFGSPGLTSTVADFASVNSLNATVSLAYLMPKGPEMFTAKDPPSHPFPTIFPAKHDECISRLLECLPPKDELLDCLASFEKRVYISCFPHVPFEITKSEVERFLSDSKKNAQIYPDMLALLFAALALGGQHSVWDRSGSKWKANAMSKELQKGDVFVAAAMQSLRLACFMHKPSLLSIQALIMIEPYLTNSGRFLDAWTLFGTTIRLAHSMGLHRHPKYLDPAPPTQRECSARQALWWWMLHMDEQYSMTLGRPLGISGIGDCPPPYELSSDPNMLRFGEFVNRFTLLARHILGTEPLVNARIDDYTDQLEGLLETLPEALQFHKSWLEEGAELPEWPLNAMATVYFCKTHTYITLLNRQRTDGCLPETGPTSSQSLPRGRAAVIQSSEHILDAFVFFYNKVPAALVSWTMGQQAFNACMLLLFDALELQKVTTGATKVERAYVVFLELQNVHKLAGLAIKRISWGMKQLRDITQKNKQAVAVQRDHDILFKGSNRVGEAAQRSSVMHKGTVMGATGMTLLEDPGLQGFSAEGFAPIQWNAINFERTLSQQSEGKRDDSRPVTGHPKEMVGGAGIVNNPSRDVRSAEVMQGIRRSLTTYSAPANGAKSPPRIQQPHSRTEPGSDVRSMKPQKRYRQQPGRKMEAHTGSQPPHSEIAQSHTASRSGRTKEERRISSDQASMMSIIPGPLPPPQTKDFSCPTIPPQPTYATFAFNGGHNLASPTNAQQIPALEAQQSHLLDVASQTSYTSFGNNPPSTSQASDASGVSYPWHPTSAGWPGLSPSNPPPKLEATNENIMQGIEYPLAHDISGDPRPYMLSRGQHTSLDEWGR